MFTPLPDRAGPTLASRALPSESLAALTEAAAAVNSTLDLNSVLQTVARLSCGVAHAEAGGVFLHDARDGKFRVAAATGSRREMLIGRDFDAKLGIAGLVLAKRGPVHIVNAAAHGHFYRQMDDIGSLRTRSIIAAHDPPGQHHRGDRGREPAGRRRLPRERSADSSCPSGTPA